MGSMIGNAATMPLFARMLSQRLDRLVVDSTGLSGRFDIQLHWTPDAGEVPYGPGGNALPGDRYLWAHDLFGRSRPTRVEIRINQSAGRVHRHRFCGEAL
jgi:hypothetical protein